MIDIVFCLHQRRENSPYLIALGATYASIRESTRASLHLHILHDDSVGANSKALLEQIVSKGDQISFRHASLVSEAYTLSQQLDNRYSPAIIWRAWIGEYFQDLRRCLLLDCDLLFLCDIRDIWKIKLGSRVLSAPLGGGWRLNREYFDWVDSSKDRYFRMCVVLINLKKLRRNSVFRQERRGFLREAFAKMGSGPGSYLLEQSLFNKFFGGACLPLPVEVFAANQVTRNSVRHADLSAKVATKKPLILDIKGWENESEFSLLFWSFLLKTAWFTRAQQAWRQFMPPGPPQSPT